jgi:predicted SnoaL-like aldol condensation-catalyzing enzyme
MKTMKLLLVVTMSLLSTAICAQHNPGTMTNQAIVKTFLDGFNDTAKIGNSLALLADDYHFKNPMVELDSKEAFIALAQEIGQVLTGVEITRMAGDGEWVAVHYIFKSNLPGMERNAATEWFRVVDGQIKASNLIYDASAWRKVYAQMEK